MHVAVADAACFDGDFNVAICEGLWFELVCIDVSFEIGDWTMHVLRWNSYVLFLEVTLFLLGVDHESFEGIWVDHVDMNRYREQGFLMEEGKGCREGYEYINMRYLILIIIRNDG